MAPTETGLSVSLPNFNRYHAKKRIAALRASRAQMTTYQPVEVPARLNALRRFADFGRNAALCGVLVFPYLMIAR